MCQETTSPIKLVGVHYIINYPPVKNKKKFIEKSLQ